MSDQHGVHPDCLQHWSDGLAEYQGIDRRLLTDPLPQLQVVLLTAAVRGRVLGPEVRSKVAGEHPVEPVQNKKLGISPLHLLVFSNVKTKTEVNIEKFE